MGAHPGLERGEREPLRFEKEEREPLRFEKEERENQ